MISQVTSQRGEVVLNEASKPESMVMTGDVRYTRSELFASGKRRGRRDRLGRSLTAMGHMQRVFMTGSVRPERRRSFRRRERRLGSERGADGGNR